MDFVSLNLRLQLHFYHVNEFSVNYYLNDPDLLWRTYTSYCFDQVGLSLVFVIYESANPHMGKAFPIFQVFL